MHIKSTISIYGELQLATNQEMPSYHLIDHLQTMGWTPETAADWVANFMGPTLASSKFNRTKIMALDDDRNALPWWMNQYFANQKAKKYTAGTAVHWYLDAVTSPARLDETQAAFADKFILMTEACTGKQS